MIEHSKSNSNSSIKTDRKKCRVVRKKTVINGVVHGKNVIAISSEQMKLYEFMGYLIFLTSQA